MRRIKLVFVVGVVMAAMLALSAGPAMADEWDGEWDHEWGDWNGHHGFNETVWLAEGTSAYDQWCSPGLPEGIWIPGCIFSDPIEEDHFLDDVVFVLDEDDIDFDDIDFDKDCDCDHDDDHFRKDGKRFHHDDDWRFREW